MIGRFTGGFGERCFNPLGKTGRMLGEEVDEYESEVEAMSVGFDDPENDGRSLVSGGWGVGHDGSAIEIVNVQFVERGTAQKGPGLGRRNRSQRLLEYAERRAAVLGQSFAPAVRLAGRKRRRHWDNWPVQPRRLPNAAVLDVIHDADEDDLEEELRRPTKKPRHEDEQKLMDVCTMVFGMGASADLLVGYKYIPDLLQNVLFPTSPASSPSHKRRRTDDDDIEMMDLEVETPVVAVREPIRPVILETTKERYLLSPSADQPDANSGRSYDIALILEAEVVVEEEPPVEADAIEGKPMEIEPTPSADVAPEAQVETTPKPGSPKELPPAEPIASMEPKSSSKEPEAKATTPIPSPQPLQHATSSDPLRSTTSPVHSPEPTAEDDAGSAPPSTPPPETRQKTPTILVEDEIIKPQFAVQVLQQNLNKNMLRFAPEGVYVYDGSGDAMGMETEWVIQVKNWKWAPRSSKEKLF
ncbi:hypothetical protein CPB83DRAFT_858689 [Crepidotus variabilis]|uniref:Uncharacterized protein n=1 Tax=Crepidotus variabilis TaxID=179855 RepID=A0A9P6EBE8_9AGAR|nr:hypothetical protein CPB83DRAFT_858689 [Crepidotus variabilis]